MRKIIALFIFLATVCCGLFGAEAKTSAAITFGINPVKSSLDSNYEENNILFGGAYFLGDINISTAKVTAAGKIYYRLSESDSFESEGQKVEIKRAYIRFRPMGDKFLEFSAGKLYSNYLAGNFFSLSEIYTGASRWGKTGVGVKSQINGFTFGAALPLTESYVTFKKNFNLNLSASYNFSEINKSVPLSFGVNYLFSRSEDADAQEDKNHSFCVSADYNPKFDGFINDFSVTVTGSFNSEPYVASSVFKNVTNYSNADLKKSNFASVNLKTNFSRVQFIAEAEAGHSTEGEMIPLYTGVQLLFPFNGWLAFKPRFYHYGALDGDNSENSRQTLEFYPRLWFTFNQWTVSAGFDFFSKQVADDEWKQEWTIPLYVKYKVGK